jgi:hypothetical protein
MSGVKATSFAQVRELLERLGDEPKVRGAFGYSQILEHCAQSVEYSLTGYPELRSAIFRATVGRIAKGKFLRQGFMQHKLDAPIPGAPDLDANANVERARTRLLTAMDALLASTAPLAPHLAFGRCTREEYEQIHSMHVAEHLTCAERTD